MSFYSGIGKSWTQLTFVLGFRQATAMQSQQNIAPLTLCRLNWRLGKWHYDRIRKNQLQNSTTNQFPIQTYRRYHMRVMLWQKPHHILPVIGCPHLELIEAAATTEIQITMPVKREIARVGHARFLRDSRLHGGSCDSKETGPKRDRNSVPGDNREA